jgi:hypothetical protein
VIRRLECGCIDEQQPNGRWVVFVLCPKHAMGRTPEQDEK